MHAQERILYCDACIDEWFRGTTWCALYCVLHGEVDPLLLVIRESEDITWKIVEFLG